MQPAGNIFLGKYHHFVDIERPKYQFWRNAYLHVVQYLMVNQDSKLKTLDIQK